MQFINALKRAIAGPKAQKPAGEVKPEIPAITRSLLHSRACFNKQ